MKIDWASIDNFKKSGFKGGWQFKHMRTFVQDDTLDEYVPRDSGVYMVLRNSSSAPEFVLKGTGGFYQRKNPNVQITRLKREWVADALVIYIGCSGNLNNRIKLLMQFGEGQAVRHWGGRLIWQLEHADQLQVCWKETLQQEETKENLISSFQLKYGKKPFANLK